MGWDGRKPELIPNLIYLSVLYPNLILLAHTQWPMSRAGIGGGILIQLDDVYSEWNSKISRKGAHSYDDYSLS